MLTKQNGNIQTNHFFSFVNFIEANKIEQDFAQRFQQQTSANDYLSSAFDSNTLPKHYGLSNSFYDDVNRYLIEIYFDE